MRPDTSITSAFCPPDPFRDAREGDGVMVREFFGERMVMLLGWKDVRAAARDTDRFDSGEAGRVPIPQETAIRPFRQIPIETNPPEHGAWKDLLQVYFRRPMQDGPKAAIQMLVAGAVDAALSRDRVEAVAGFALPLQSRALAILLDCDPALADDWIGWGMHAFRTNGQTDPAKAARFLEFIDGALDRARGAPDDSFFSYLHRATIGGRALTEDEKRGACHLALSGGRDTIINSIAGTIAYLAETPETLAALRDRPDLIDSAAEELFRVLSPLPQIGRVCPHGFARGGAELAPGDRATLCWASANRDRRVFDEAERIRIDRTPNPHVAFGAGAHSCLGAPMARLILRSLLRALTEKVGDIQILEAEPRDNGFGTPYLFHALQVRFLPTHAVSPGDTT